MKTFLDHFTLHEDREKQETVIEAIKVGVVFKGGNLWVLIFAIFIASLGLNLNSTAVIIGAMLISPLMGPIMGMGLAAGINDVLLLRSSITNYFLATSVALATSTIYFIISPLNEAHSEILARTAPNVYDVLIALFGGLAGILTTSSKHKGNVIPGVAIATALMPPLCTAGYGLATLKWDFFFGAFYLFVINTVFIALATFIIVRLLNFPYIHLPDQKAKQKTRRILAVVVICTLLPSLYFGYDMVERNKFIKKATKFVEMEAVFPNNYLLSKTIDSKFRKIELIYGGEEIQESEIEELEQKMPMYEMENTTLLIKQGFSYLSEDEDEEKTGLVTKVLQEKETETQELKLKLDSITEITRRNEEVLKELKALRPDVLSLVISPAVTAKSPKQEYAIVNLKTRIPLKEQRKLAAWLKVRLQEDDLKVIFPNAR